MRATQKRNLFEKMFGELLCRHGFVYRNDTFVRLRPGGVLLSVDVEFLSLGEGRIRFEAIAFCCGITRPLDGFCMTLPLRRRDGDSAQEEADFRSMRDGRMRYGEFLEARFRSSLDRQFEQFRDEISARLVSIETVRDALAFHEWSHGYFGHLACPNIPQMECMYLGEYEEALQYTRILLERWRKGRESHLREMEKLTNAMEGDPKAAERLEMYRNVLLRGWRQTCGNARRTQRTSSRGATRSSKAHPGEHGALPPNLPRAVSGAGDIGHGSTDAGSSPSTPRKGQAAKSRIF